MILAVPCDPNKFLRKHICDNRTNSISSGANTINRKTSACLCFCPCYLWTPLSIVFFNRNATTVVFDCHRFPCHMDIDNHLLGKSGSNVFVNGVIYQLIDNFQQACRDSDLFLCLKNKPCGFFWSDTAYVHSRSQEHVLTICEFLEFFVHEIYLLVENEKLLFLHYQNRSLLVKMV